MLVLVSGTRSSSSACFVDETSSTCGCLIWDIAQSSGKLKLKHQTIVTSAKGKRPGKLKLENPKAKGQLRCSECFAVIGKGKFHFCSSSQKATNVSNALSSPEKEQVASMTLRQKSKKLAPSGDSVTGSSVPIVQLKTGGRQTVKLGTSKESAVMSHDQLSMIRVGLGLSGKQAEGLARDLRTVYGWKSIQPGLREAMAEAKGSLSSFFTVKKWPLKVRQMTVQV